MAIDIEKWIQIEDDAWSSQDVEKILSIYSDDCVYEDTALGEIFHGKEEIRAFLLNSFEAFPDFKAETKGFFAADNQICNEGVISGTHIGDVPNLPPATKKSFTIRCAHICKLRDGKAIRITDYYDGASVMQQLGHLPTPPKP